MELDQLVSRVKSAGVSLGALNGKLLVLDSSKRLGDDVVDQLDEHNDALVQFFMRKARKQDAYWRRQIGEQFSASTLFEGRALCVAEQTGNGTARLAFDGALGAHLRALGAEAAETLFGLAWACLLARYSGERQAVYFAAASGRSVGLNGIADLKGLIVNLHPVQQMLPDDSDVCLLLEASAAHRQHEREYGFPAFTDHNKFADVRHRFDSLLVFEHGAGPAPAPGIELCSLANLAALELGLVVIVTDQCGIELQYARHSMSDQSAQALLGHLEAIVGQLAYARAGAASLRGVQMVGAAERAQLFALGDGGPGVSPAASCMHALFEQAAAATPDATAVLWHGQALSYGELNRKANQLAHHLMAQRAQAGGVVGICMARSPELLIAMLAVLKAGCAYLPLDPKYPAARLDFMLGDAGAALVIADAPSAPQLCGAAQPVLVYDSGASAMLALPVENIAVEAAGIDAASLAYIIYTSGSTGHPKGVMIGHAAALSFLAWSRAQFSDAELRSVLCSTSICFDLSIFEIFVPLSVGSQVVLVDSILDLFSGAPVPDISLINSVPSAMAELVEHSPIPSSVLTVCLAGEPLRRKLVNRIFASPTVQAVYNLYGPSEYTTYATFCALQRADAHEPRIGRALHDTVLLVLDADGQPAPIGVKGELFIGGRNLSAGYINRPELTAEKFLANPFAPHGPAMLYRTGDYVRWNRQGELEFIGRCDEQVKLRGFRVELGEIEAQLNAHAAVDSAAVVVRADQDGEQCLVAYVALEQQGEGERAAVRDSLKTSLATALPAHMVPEIYIFLAQLPLTLNGKIDRKRLPQPDTGELQARQYVAPVTEIERALCGHFEKLLGVARVGLHDDFFAMGGHSLLAFRLLILIRTAFNIEMPLKALFECPTVSQLGVLVAQSTPAGALPAIARRERGARPAASFAQQRFWFLYQLDERSAEYNLPLAFKLRGRFDPAACQRALDTILARHEVLRTLLRDDDGSLYQQIEAARPAVLRTIDLSHLAPNDAALAARAQFDLDLNSAFRLDTELPVRFLVARVGQSEHHLLFNVHHVATDGWSINLMLREFCALYGSFAHGTPATLAELPIQYADFAQWQRSCLSGAALDQLRAQWKQTLRDVPRLHQLPLDHPRAPVQQGVGRGMKKSIDGALLAQFKSLCASQGATLFMGLQTLYAAVLGRWSQRDDIVMGTPVAGRTVADTEPLIGCFMNGVTLRNRFAHDASFSSMLGEARSMILDALEGQSFPFDALVSECELRRDPSHQAIFQVWFVLQSQSAEYPRIDGLEIGPLDARVVAANIVHFDLSLNATEVEGRLELLWEYQHLLFDQASIDWLAGCFELLMAHAVRAPDAALLALPLAAPAGAPTVAPRAPAASLLERLAARAADAPDALALLQDGRRITYATLEARSQRVAAFLAAHGVDAGQQVLVQLPHGIERMIAMLAILKRGAAFALVPAGADPRRWIADGVAGCLLSEVPDGAARCWAMQQAEAADYGVAAPYAGAAMGLAYVDGGALHASSIDTALLCQQLQAQGERCGLSAASTLLILPQTMHFAPFEWLLGLSLGASLYLATQQQAPGPCSHMTLTPGLLAGLDPARATGLASIVLTGAVCASWNAWRWSATCKVFNAFGTRHLPFITCDAVVDGQPVTLGRMSVAGSALLLDEHGYASPNGMPADLCLRLNQDSGILRHATARILRRADGRHVYAGGGAAPARLRGYELCLEEIESRIGALAEVTGVMLQIVGSGPDASLVALVASARSGAQRRPWLVALGRALQAMLPLYQLPDALLLVDALPLGPDGKLERAFLSDWRTPWDEQYGALAHFAQAPYDAQLAGPRAELRLPLPLPLPATPGRGGCSDEQFLLGAFGIMMALESGQGALCMSAATLDQGLPAMLVAGQLAVHAPLLACRLPAQATLGDIAPACGPRLAPYLHQIDGAGHADYGRLLAAAQCQFLYLPDGADGCDPEHVAPCGPISLTVSRSGDQLALAWRYRSDCYTEEKVGALSRRYARLLALLAGDPEASIATLGERLDADVKDKLLDLKNRFKLTNT
jgi:amino acid adenylation domain-containing protein